MNIFAFAALALTGTFLAIFVKRFGDEYAVCVSAFCVCAFLLALLPQIDGIISKIKEYAGFSGIGSENFGVLLKAVGIGYITQITSDLCADAGESSIASKAELAGKLAILVLAIPVVEQIFVFVREMI